MHLTRIHHHEKAPSAQKKLRHHAFVVQRNLTAALAFSTTLFLFCMEHVKAFTTTTSSTASTLSLLNENSLLMLASGAHSLAHKWRMTQRSVHRSYKSNAVSAARGQEGTSSSQRGVTTRLKMAFGFDSFAPSSSPTAPPLLDMKTSISAFGGWYNTMDPVARPPIYEDDAIDFSIMSPSDNWPSSMEDDGLVLSSFTSSQGTNSASTAATNSSTTRAKSLLRRRRRPGAKTIRRIADWVVHGGPTRVLSMKRLSRDSSTFL